MLVEKYSSLQEEAAAKTKKLKKIWALYQKVKEEVSRKVKVPCPVRWKIPEEGLSKPYH